MPAPELMTQTLTISEVKTRLSRLVNEVYRHETRVLVEKSGIPVAALVSAEDLQRLDRLDQEWATRTRALEVFGTAFADIPATEREQEVERIVAQVRAANRDAADI
jgi:prevent-host-death family protein